MHVLASGFLVELDNNSLKIVEPKVDADGFFLELSLDLGLFDPLRPRQIDQMNRSYCLDVAVGLGGLDVDDEDAVGTS